MNNNILSQSSTNNSVVNMLSANDNPRKKLIDLTGCIRNSVFVPTSSSKMNSILKKTPMSSESVLDIGRKSWIKFTQKMSQWHHVTPMWTSRVVSLSDINECIEKIAELKQEVPIELLSDLDLELDRFFSYFFSQCNNGLELKVCRLVYELIVKLVVSLGKHSDHLIKKIMPPILSHITDSSNFVEIATKCIKDICMSDSFLLYAEYILDQCTDQLKLEEKTICLNYVLDGLLRHDSRELESYRTLACKLERRINELSEMKVAASYRYSKLFRKLWPNSEVLNLPYQEGTRCTQETKAPGRMEASLPRGNSSKKTVEKNFESVTTSWSVSASCTPMRTPEKFKYDRTQVLGLSGKKTMSSLKYSEMYRNDRSSTGKKKAEFVKPGASADSPSRLELKRSLNANDSEFESMLASLSEVSLSGNNVARGGYELLDLDGWEGKLKAEGERSASGVVGDNIKDENQHLDGGIGVDFLRFLENENQSVERSRKDLREDTYLKFCRSEALTGEDMSCVRGGNREKELAIDDRIHDGQPHFNHLFGITTEKKDIHDELAITKAELDLRGQECDMVNKGEDGIHSNKVEDLRRSAMHSNKVEDLRRSAEVMNVISPEEENIKLLKEVGFGKELLGPLKCSFLDQICSDRASMMGVEAYLFDREQKNELAESGREKDFLMDEKAVSYLESVGRKSEDMESQLMNLKELKGSISNQNLLPADENYIYNVFLTVKDKNIGEAYGHIHPLEGDPLGITQCSSIFSGMESDLEMSMELVEVKYDWPNEEEQNLSYVAEGTGEKEDKDEEDESEETEVFVMTTDGSKVEVMDGEKGDDRVDMSIDYSSLREEVLEKGDEASVCKEKGLMMSFLCMKDDDGSGWVEGRQWATGREEVCNEKGRSDRFVFSGDILDQAEMSFELPENEDRHHQVERGEDDDSVPMRFESPVYSGAMYAGEEKDLDKWREVSKDEEVPMSSDVCRESDEDFVGENGNDELNCENFDDMEGQQESSDTEDIKDDPSEDQELKESEGDQDMDKVNGLWIGEREENEVENDDHFDCNSKLEGSSEEDTVAIYEAEVVGKSSQQKGVGNHQKVVRLPQKPRSRSICKKKVRQDSCITNFAVSDICTEKSTAAKFNGIDGKKEYVDEPALERRDKLGLVKVAPISKANDLSSEVESEGISWKNGSKGRRVVRNKSFKSNRKNLCDNDDMNHGDRKTKLSDNDNVTTSRKVYRKGMHELSADGLSGSGNYCNRCEKDTYVSRKRRGASNLPKRASTENYCSSVNTDNNAQNTLASQKSQDRCPFTPISNRIRSRMRKRA